MIGIDDRSDPSDNFAGSNCQEGLDFRFFVERMRFEVQQFFLADLQRRNPMRVARVQVKWIVELPVAIDSI